MNCNCNIVQVILGAIIVIFSFMLDLAFAGWIILVAGILVLIHGLACRKCKSCEMPEKSMNSKTSMSKKSSKKRR